MDLTSYVDSIRRELAAVAEAGGDDARALAERLVAPLESSVRLALLEALSAAAAEITSDLAPGSVDLRLRGRDPSFVVTAPPVSDAPIVDAAPPVAPPPVSAEGDDGAMARVNVRLAEPLKNRIEAAANRAGLSVNAWFVRAASAALDSDDRARRPDWRAPRGGQRYTGWVR